MRSVPVPPAEELAELREAGKTRKDIADKYGVSLARVKRWISKLNIPSKTPVNKEANETPSISTISTYLFEDGMSLMEKCKVVLGGRMRERRGMGYTLDGRPCSSEQIRRAAKL